VTMVHDLTGKKFERLLVLAHSEHRYGETYWLCQCDCGVEKVVRGSSLVTGKTKSCGCFARDKITQLNKTYSARRKHGLAGTPEYHAWHDMVSRCNKTSHESYTDYGGRGITVCERWHNFENFISDMGSRPSPSHSLERVNNSEGYYPENCIWATRFEQAINKRARKNNISGVRGVSWVKERNKWLATIGVMGELIYLGTFDSLEEATKVRKEAEIKYWKESEGS
jgi:hypothetical protein